MYCSEFFSSSWWWVWPILMITLCFFMMRRWRGPRMCGFGSRQNDRHRHENSDSAWDILDKRHAAGEMDTVEYEEKKRSPSMR